MNIYDQLAAIFGERSGAELASTLRAQLDDLNVTDIPLQMLAGEIATRLGELDEYEAATIEADEVAEVVEVPVFVPVLVPALSGITVNVHGRNTPIEFAPSFEYAR